jgi:hypothetical protein
MVAHLNQGAVFKRCWVRILFNRNPPYRAFPAAANLEDLRRQYTVPLLRLRPTSGMLRVVLHPHGRLDIHMGSGRLGSALPWRYFLAVRRQLTPIPTSVAYLSVPSSPSNNS